MKTANLLFIAITLLFAISPDCYSLPLSCRSKPSSSVTIPSLGHFELSNNGDTLFFSSSSKTLSATQALSDHNVYSYSITNKAFSLVSLASNGAPSTQDAKDFSISDDGRYVAFGGGYLPGDSIFLRDRNNNTTILVSDNAYTPLVTSDSSAVVYTKYGDSSFQGIDFYDIATQTISNNVIPLNSVLTYPFVAKDGKSELNLYRGYYESIYQINRTLDQSGNASYTKGSQLDFKYQLNNTSLPLSTQNFLTNKRGSNFFRYSIQSLDGLTTRPFFLSRKRVHLMGTSSDGRFLLLEGRDFSKLGSNSITDINRRLVVADLSNSKLTCVIKGNPKFKKLQNVAISPSGDMVAIGVKVGTENYRIDFYDVGF